MATSLTDAILGCIVGGALGDAAGAEAEGAPGWRLTDDTQLTLATCDALTGQDAVCPARLAASFLRWFRARRLTGLGASTLKALRDLDAGAHWALSGCKGERAAGNGAAMRIAPLAFRLDPLADGSRRLIRDVCRITHHSDEAYVGAFAVVLALHAAKGGEPSLEHIASHLPATGTRERLLAYAALPAGVSIAEAAARFGASGYVIESVPLALFAASRLQDLGFTAMLGQMIAAGGDTDTNASLAGQVAGTTLGLGGLPADLLDKLPEAEMVLGVGRIFAEDAARRNPASDGPR